MRLLPPLLVTNLIIAKLTFPTNKKVQEQCCHHFWTLAKAANPPLRELEKAALTIWLIC